MNVSIPLQPIQSGLLKTMRYIKRSYNKPLEHGQDLRKEYGDVVMQKAGKMCVVHLFGADAHRLCLLNPNQTFSNKKAWDMIIGRIFSNGLTLRDGDDHRYHRRLMQAGFKSKAMQGYLGQMIPQIRNEIASWSGQGTLLWRGIKARQTMCDFFLPMIEQRRDGESNNLFSLLCKAKDEDGRGYTDQEIVDHMIFLMMAAHDTTTSTLTSITYALARNPEWQ